MSTKQCGYNLRKCEMRDKAGVKVASTIYTCVLCSLILREPLQLLCGDRVCTPCLPKEEFTCPVCGEEINPKKRFRDRSCENDLREFVVVCKCGWTGALEAFEFHVESCSEFGVKEEAASAEVIDSEKDELKREIVTLRKEIKEIRLLVFERDTKHGTRDTTHETSTTALATLSSTGIQSTELSRLAADVAAIKLRLEELNETVQSLSQALPHFESVLDELNLKLEILEVKSTTGVYVWKVNELGRRVREARSGKTTSLYSPPFYTDVHGYRVCLRAYLFGDGVGKGTHISLFIVVMRSEYDEILPWPFQHYVILSLINLNNPDENIVHRFHPGKDSASFKKPAETFNLASGFPQFASVDVLENNAFVRDDTMYFKVELQKPSEDASGRTDSGKHGKRKSGSRK